mgnify:FL=1
MPTKKQADTDRSNMCGSAGPRDAGQETKAPRPWTCHDCKFCVWDPFLWMQTLNSVAPILGFCANQPDAPGQLRPLYIGRPCRNFQRKPRPKTEPPAPLDDDARYIPLTRGLFAIVDAKHYEWLSQHKWSVQGSKYGRTCYAVRREKGRKIFMHREIMKTPDGMFVDHVNRNGLDNREANMRNCTRLQNLQNRYWQAGRSRYRGVSPVGDKWQAVLGYDGDVHYLGLFDDEVEAAKARDRKAYELAGEFAYLNFPDDFPPHETESVKREMPETEAPPPEKEP